MDDVSVYKSGDFALPLGEVIRLGDEPDRLGEGEASLILDQPLVIAKCDAYLAYTMTFETAMSHNP